MKKILLGDFLYYLQLIGAIAIGINQLLHMIFVSTVGLSISAYVFTALFVTINLFLALASHQKHNSRVTKQTVIIYISGVVVYGSWLIVLFASDNQWNETDWLVVILVSIMVAVIALYARYKNLPVLDPVIKGSYGVAFRAIPHLALAWKLHHDGNAGLSIITILLFHMLTLCRIFQIFRKYKTTWDRNKTGLAIAEIGNETSWIVVTIVWAL